MSRDTVGKSPQIPHEYRPRERRTDGRRHRERKENAFLLSMDGTLESAERDLIVANLCSVLKQKEHMTRCATLLYYASIVSILERLLV